MTDKKKNLYYLDELSDYKVASDDPDVRGWEVKDADNRVIGKVDNLLVSKSKEKVVYLDVEVDQSILDKDHKPYRKSASEDVHEFINRDGENHLIVPVGLVRLNEDDKYVYTDKVNHQTFAETKRKKRGTDFDREYETVVLESYERGRTTADTSATPRADRSESARNEGTGTSGASATSTAAAGTGGETPTSGTTGNVGTGRDISGTGTTGTGRDTGTPTTGTTKTGRETSGTGTTGTGRDSGGGGTDKSTTSRTGTTSKDQTGVGRTGGAGTGPEAQGVRNQQTSEPGDRDLEDRPQNRNSGAAVDNTGTGRRTTDTADDDSFYDRDEFDRSNYRQRRNNT